MVQSTEPREGSNLASERRTGCDRPTRWRVLPEPQMCPILLVVAHMFSHQPLQMPLVQDDYVIQQVASAASYPTLRNAVLPRTAKGRAHRLASHVFRRRDYVVAKLGVAVE